MDIRRGFLKAFDAGSYTATVQIVGSLPVWLSGLPVARNIPGGEMVAGRNVAVLFFEPGNANDAVVTAVWS